MAFGKFFAVGFGCGGSPPKERKKREVLRTVDGRGHTCNRPNRDTGFCLCQFQHVPVQQGFGVIVPMAVGVVVLQGGGRWLPHRDSRGVRYYRHSRTLKKTYDDPHYTQP